MGVAGIAIKAYRHYQNKKATAQQSVVLDIESLRIDPAAMDELVNLVGQQIRSQLEERAREVERFLA